ncbi:MAG: sigma-70 family RNA polymerase sigma factor [Bacteroidota bacterium]|nr:sigma-70 family RNA polymerase sigma factor [Bacteroidota bacterium]
MKNATTTKQEQIVIQAYEKYRPVVCGFFRKRLVHNFEAEDLTQDVFTKLLTLSAFIREEAVGILIFTIARNLAVDYNRRFFKRLEVTQALMEREEGSSCNSTEDTLFYHELLHLEKEAVNQLSLQRQKVYSLSLNGEYSYKEMAQMLELSPRTIEHHLISGRAEVRKYIAACY